MFIFNTPVFAVKKNKIISRPDEFENAYLFEIDEIMEMQKRAMSLDHNKIPNEELSALYFLLGQAYEEQKELSKSWKYYALAFKYYPENKEAFKKSYENYMSMMDEHGYTIDEITQRIDKFDKNQVPNLELASLYASRAYVYKKDHNDLKNALADYNMAIKYNPDDTISLLNSSCIKYQFKDDEGAAQDLEKLIRINPEDISVYSLLIKIYYGLKQYDKVIADSTKAILLKNKNPDAFYYRGRAQLALRQIDKGLQDLDYAKRQYLQENNIEKYKETAELINAVKNIIEQSANPAKNIIKQSANPVVIHEHTLNNNIYQLEAQRQKEHSDFINQQMIRSELGNINQNLMMQNLYLRDIKFRSY